MTHRMGSVVVIAREEDDICELCGSNSRHAPQARLIENYIRSLLPEMDAAVEALEAAETPRAAN